MDFKRALVRPQKGTFCKSIRRLLEAKRACFGFELHENNLQILGGKGINSYRKNKKKPPNIFSLGAYSPITNPFHQGSSAYSVRTKTFHQGVVERLAHCNLACNLLLFNLNLWQGNGEYTVCNTCSNTFLLNIIR